MTTNPSHAALYAELERQLHVGLAAPEAPLFSLELAKLSEEANMRRLIETHIPLIKTDAPDASAVSVAVGLGHLACSQQYALSVHETALDLSPDRIVLHLYQENGYAAFAFTIGHTKAADLPAAGPEREARRRDALEATYRETLRPIIEQAGRTAGIHPRELWGQLPTSLRYYIGVWKEAAGSEQAERRIEDDCRFLREGLSPAVFGLKTNPYAKAPVLTESPLEPGKMIPLKNACCLYYKWGDGEYCFACPRLKEQDREAIRQARRASAASEA